jgi:hypothetical protein
MLRHSSDPHRRRLTIAFGLALLFTANLGAVATSDEEEAAESSAVPAASAAVAPQGGFADRSDTPKMKRPWGRTFPIGPNRSMTLVPRDDLFRDNTANPHRSTFAVQHVRVSDSEIPNAGSPRFGLKLGGRFGLFRVHPTDDPDRGIQLNIEAGFRGQFDRENSTDNVGWDGIYGLIATFDRGQRLQYKVGLHHTSSHVGDEYMLRTLRTRINYTREELQLGVNLLFGKHWRVYGEGGYAFDQRNEELQEPGRLQTGFDYQRDESLFRGLLGWYVAVDGTAWEENDWEVSRTIQAGFILPSTGRLWRVGLEHYDGRAQIGEFFQDDESYVTFGVWLDL